MTATEIISRALKRLDESAAAPEFYSVSEALERLNMGERLYACLTLCLETTANYALAASTPFDHLFNNLPGFLVPLRVRILGGARLEPARLAELDALDPQWQKTPGAPERYGVFGFDLLAATPQPSAITTLAVTYARLPDPMTAGSTPAIPAEDHTALIDWLQFSLRLKEGGQEFLQAVPHFERFLDSAGRRGRFVRRRSLAQRYDQQPFELAAFDRSRLRKLGRILMRKPPGLVHDETRPRPDAS